MPLRQSTQNYTARKLMGKKPGAMSGGLTRTLRNRLRSTSAPKVINRPVLSDRALARSNRARIRAGVLHAATKWGLKNKRIIDRLQSAAFSRFSERVELSMKIIGFEAEVLE